MKGSGLRRMTAVIAICALVGALAGIAGSAAAPSKQTQAQKAAKAKAKAKAKAQKKAQLRARRGGPGKLFFGPGPGGPGGPGGGPVHSETIVPNADGTDFITITADAGVLKSVDGNTLHIKQGTDKATYKDDAAIDVGASPTVVRNHEKAALSDLKEGDHVRIIQGTPKGTVVIAEDDAFIAKEKKEHKGFGFGRHHGGPPPPGAPAGPGYPGDDDQGGNENGSNSGSSSSGGTSS